MKLVVDSVPVQPEDCMFHVVLRRPAGDYTSDCHYCRIANPSIVTMTNTILSPGIDVNGRCTLKSSGCPYLVCSSVATDKIK